jgi:Bacterial cadherin-like domain
MFTVGVTNVNEAPGDASDADGVDQRNLLAVQVAGGVVASDTDPDGGRDSARSLAAARGTGA